MKETVVTKLQIALDIIFGVIVLKISSILNFCFAAVGLDFVLDETKKVFEVGTVIVFFIIAVIRLRMLNKEKRNKS